MMTSTGDTETTVFLDLENPPPATATAAAAAAAAATTTATATNDDKILLAAVEEAVVTTMTEYRSNPNREDLPEQTVVHRDTLDAAASAGRDEDNPDYLSDASSVVEGYSINDEDDEVAGRNTSTLNMAGHESKEDSDSSRGSSSNSSRSDDDVIREDSDVEVAFLQQQSSRIFLREWDSSDDEDSSSIEHEDADVRAMLDSLMVDEPQTAWRRCRIGMWQWTRFHLHVIAFPVILLVSVAVPVVLVVFFFALMVVAIIVLLCAYYCCSTRARNGTALPFHVLIRQILEAVVEDRNGEGGGLNGNDGPTHSREEIQNAMVRRTLLQFDVTDPETGAKVEDAESADEAIRADRMHQDMYPVILSSEDVSPPCGNQTDNKDDKDDASDSKRGSYKKGKKLFRPRQSRKASKKKIAEAPTNDRNNTYDFRLAPHKIVFQTDPLVNQSKLFLLKRTYVFSAPLPSKKLIRDDDDDDDDLIVIDMDNPTSNSNNIDSYDVILRRAEAQERNVLRDDSSSSFSSDFFPVLPSSYSSSSSSDEESRALENPSLSEESFLIDDYESATSPEEKANIARAIQESLEFAAARASVKDAELKVDCKTPTDIESGLSDATVDNETKDTNVGSGSKSTSMEAKTLERMAEDLDLLLVKGNGGKCDSIDDAYSETFSDLKKKQDILPTTDRDTKKLGAPSTTENTTKSPTSPGEAQSKTPNDTSQHAEESNSEVSLAASPPQNTLHPMDVVEKDTATVTPIYAEDVVSPFLKLQGSKLEKRGISSYCNICLGEYEVGDTVVWSRRPKGCHHAWHEECLLDWLERKPTCPSCRSDFFDVEDTPAEQGEDSEN